MLRDIRYMLRDDEKDQYENKGCKLVRCKCGKEFYTTGHQKLCKDCQYKKEKKKLLDEQYRIAARLGLLKRKLDKKKQK